MRYPMTDNPISQHAQGDVFFQNLIDAYITNPRFIRRDWLAEELNEKLCEPGKRFILLIAEPGAGKSVFMAQLAHDHPEWLRYFIRRGQRTPLGDVGVHSFLLRIGYQLAAHFPELFTQEQLKIAIEQRIETLEEQGEVVGAEVKRILASPFYYKVLQIKQHIERNDGKVVGLRVEELVIDPRLIDPKDLQYMALIDPALALLKREPKKKLVVLVDALDEIRYHGAEGTLLKWLIDCPELPKNVRFILTSRPPEGEIITFMEKKQAFIRPLPIDSKDDRVRNELRTYVSQKLVGIPEVNKLLSASKKGVEDFSKGAVEKADGNIGYLDALARGIDQALSVKEKREEEGLSLLKGLLSLKELPKDTQELYGFFLHQIKNSPTVKDRSIRMRDESTGRDHFLSMWTEVYNPILGVLSVAFEPMTVDQIRALGAIAGSRDDVIEAKEWLRQFLDEEGDRCRFYHDTLPDFLTAPSTKANSQTTDLYQDLGLAQRRIIHFYRRLVGDWPAARWTEMDTYGWRHLLAHAEQAGPERPAPVLFDICDAGFLEAKRQIMTSSVALEEDWVRALRACQAVGDYARFVRYGLQRARQFMDISPLLSTPVARTAAWLAVRRGEDAVDRLEAEIALIPHLYARIGAEQALLDELIAASVKYPAVEHLIHSLDLALATLPTGEDRDRYLADYLGALARARHPGWSETVRSHLDEVKSVLPRVSLLAILSRGCAEDGDLQTALGLLHEALEECQGITISDDLVPDLIQMMTGTERVKPAYVLAGGLRTILTAAPSLAAQDCANVVSAARTQFDRIMRQFDRSEAALLLLNLTQLAIHALDAAGLRDIARDMAREVMQPYLRMSPDGDATEAIQGLVQPWTAVELLALVPILALFGGERDREVWWQLFTSYLVDVGPPLDFVWIAQTASDLSTTGIGAAEVNKILEAVEERTKSLSLDEVGFVIAGNLALGYGRANNPVHAHDLLSRVLDQISVQQLGLCHNPEQAEARANGLTAVWAAACRCGEQDLVERTLAWLQEIAFRVVPFSNRAVVWHQAIPAVRDLADLDLAADAFDQLKLRLVENVEPGPFLATAYRQFADAYIELGMPGEARRLLADCARLARTTMAGTPMVELLATAASYYARIGDVEASTGLLRELLQVIPGVEGDNIQAACLGDVLNGIGKLASVSPSGKRAAAWLLDEAVGIAQSIGLDEYALRALAAVVLTAAAHDLAAPVNAMTERLRKGSGAVLQVAWALHQVGQEGDVQQLLGRVETAVEHMPRKADYERETVCQRCAELISFYDAMGSLQQSAHWRELTGALVGQIQDPTSRTSACANLAQIEARFKDARSAGTWLAEAVDAWHRIEERLYASRYIGNIYQAWATISDPEERWRRMDTLGTVFCRVPDLDERDAWQARLALSFLEDGARFRELMAPVVSKGGIEVLLSALYDTKAIPPGILPEALYDLLEKASRLSRLGFAGFTLLATQTGIRHHVLDSRAAVPALAMLEAAFRDIVTVDRLTI